MSISTTGSGEIGGEALVLSPAEPDPVPRRCLSLRVLPGLESSSSRVMDEGRLGFCSDVAMGGLIS